MKYSYAYPNWFLVLQFLIRIKILPEVITWESAPEDTSTLRALEKARPVILFWWPLSLVLTCALDMQQLTFNLIQTINNQELWRHRLAVDTSSTRTLYIWMEESSIPIAIILLSWGWNAKNVAAGGGGMKVVIVCICTTNLLHLSGRRILVKTKYLTKQRLNPSSQDSFFMHCKWLLRYDSKSRDVWALSTQGRENSSKSRRSWFSKFIFCSRFLMKHHNYGW